MGFTAVVQHGGPTLILLLILSLGVFTVAVERSIVIGLTLLKRDKAKLKKVMDLVQDGKLKSIADEGKESSDYAVRALTNAFNLSENSVSQALEHTASKEISRLTVRLSFLELSVALAPSLGLLGTILGLIKVFGFFSGKPVQTPDLMAGGIAQALMSTGYGLGLALVATCFYSLFLMGIQHVKDELEDVCTRAQITVLDAD